MSAMAHTFLHVILQAIALSNIYITVDSDYASIEITLCWISLAVPVPLGIFLIYLMTFHSWIKFHGFSTYEYILWKRMKIKLYQKYQVSFHTKVFLTLKKFLSFVFENPKITFGITKIVTVSLYRVAN